MEIVNGITTHSIVLCVDKRERGMVLEGLLKKKGFRVTTVYSLYEGLRYVEQEMPHLVICDSILSDGNAGNIYDRLKSQKMLKNTPILVLVAKKTREQLTPLTGRNFAGFLLGQFDGAALLGKIKEIFSTTNHVSPYFMSFNQDGMPSDFTISLDATVMGLSGDQVICRSESEIDGGAALVCVPEDNKFSPVLLKQGSNIVNGENIFNLFPLSRIRGKGRKWITELPSVDLDAAESADEDDAGPAKVRKVVFFDPNAKRFDQFKRVLAGYDIDLVHASTVQKAIQLIQRDSAALGCVYFQELTGTNTGMVKEVLAKLPDGEKPPIIVGTSSLNMKSTEQLRYIKKPFGLGVLVEMMTAAFKASDNIGENLASAHTAANVACNYQAPAKLIGIDEVGGIIQLKFPFVTGNRVKLVHPFLEKIWDGDVLAQITATAPLPKKPDVWQARFEAVTSKGNKVKYYEKIEKEFVETYPSAVKDDDKQSA